MRLPEFAEIEHRRVRPDTASLPDVPVEALTSEVHELSLELFSKTNLSLQDSLVFASAVGMRADALVSNDDDFKRAFNERIGSMASEITGKPLLLVDHRLPSSRPHEKQPSLHGMLLESFHRHYDGHPSRGRPLWIDRRGGAGDWYLAYQHPLPPMKSQVACIVPGVHSVSILDEHSWTVCEVESIHHDKESLPDGITPESIGRIERYHAGQRDHRPEIRKYFRRPVNDGWGYVRISMALKEFPPSWRSWERPGEGKRAGTKRRAPRGALGFVETNCGNGSPWWRVEVRMCRVRQSASGRQCIRSPSSGPSAPPGSRPRTHAWPVDHSNTCLESGSIGITLFRGRHAARAVGTGRMAGHSTLDGASPTDREIDSPSRVPLAPDYLRRIRRLEAMPGNASGADKSWVHRAHADAVRHLSSAKRR